MSIVNKATLKTYFETGDIPTQQEFEDLIDSLLGFLDNKVYGWQKVTINYDDFQPQPLSSTSINAFLVPAGFQVNRVILIPITTFSGGTISEADIKLHESSDSLIIVNTDLDVFAAIVDVSGIISPGYIATQRYLSDISSSSFIRIFINTKNGTDGLNDLDQGSLDIYYRLDEVPF